MAKSLRADVQLTGVQETLLWTLYHRALEARRPDAVLRDPLAVELVNRLDYPFEERFGTDGGLAQWQALRVQCFDREVRRFLAEHPDGTVVALGEGLETQFWRVDNGRMSWVSVDVAEVVELRHRLLPRPPRLRAVAASAFDPRWMKEGDISGAVLVTAQGLLMYFELTDVHRLIVAIAERFPGDSLVFDTVPKWLSARSRRGKLKTDGGYQVPAWPWGMTSEEERRLAGLHPNITEVRPLRPPPGRGALHGYVLPLVTQVPAIRRMGLNVFRVRFSRAEAAGDSVQ